MAAGLPCRAERLGQCGGACLDLAPDRQRDPARDQLGVDAGGTGIP